MARAGALSNSIDTVLRLDRQSGHFENWFTSVTSNRERNLALSTYFAYDDIRLRLASELMTIEAYKAQIELACSDNPTLGASYRNRAITVIAYTKQRLETIENKGWAGSLASQRTMAARFLTRRDKFSEACAARLDRFLEETQATSDIAQYRQSEAIWIDIIKSCTSLAGGSHE